MMLRVSVEMRGGEVDLAAVTRPGEGAGPSVEGSEELLAFADAVVGGEPDEITSARAALLDRLGAEHVVEAAAVVANFQRMNRIADATGIPLDGVVMAMTGDFRGELGIDAFRTAARTQPLGVLGRLSAPVLRRLARYVMPRMARRIAPGSDER
jgi:DNA-binding phage protein